MAGVLGRPTLLNEALLGRAKTYLIDGFQEIGNTVPSVAGLSCYLGVSKKAIYNWADESKGDYNDPIRIDFVHTLAAIQAKQEMMLIDGGLSQRFSGTITKLMMANHGYSDKVETDVTTNGESVNKPTTINLVAPMGNKND